MLNSPNCLCEKKELRDWRAHCTGEAEELKQHCSVFLQTLWQQWLVPLDPHSMWSAMMWIKTAWSFPGWHPVTAEEVQSLDTILKGLYGKHVRKIATSWRNTRDEMHGFCFISGVRQAQMTGCHAMTSLWKPADVLLGAWLKERHTSSELRLSITQASVILQRPVTQLQWETPMRTKEWWVCIRNRTIFSYLFSGQYSHISHGCNSP